MDMSVLNSESLDNLCYSTSISSPTREKPPVQEPQRGAARHYPQTHFLIYRCSDKCWIDQKQFQGSDGNVDWRGSRKPTKGESGNSQYRQLCLRILLESTITEE